MFCEEVCLGNSSMTLKFRELSDTLNARVLDKVNGSQELAMLTSFARESNERLFKKCLHDRISDIASWHWVLSDLSKRLEESINGLKYEHNALSVVVQRIHDEIRDHSREGSRPGAICPLTDMVEEAIQEELKFLCEQKKSFEKLIPELEKQIGLLEKTRKKIETDIVNKESALNIEETCAHKDYSNSQIEVLKRERKKGSPVARWVKRCSSLKQAGLNALGSGIATRQQVRKARVQLSVTAQTYAMKVDAALRRRLHENTLKLQDLNWQRKEAVRDYNSLEEELTLAEGKVLETMDHERIITARIADRTLRPSRELTKDEVNKKLREEQNQLRRFVKDLRHNVEDIVALQNNIKETIANMDCCAADLMKVVTLDEQRISCRQGEHSQSSSSTVKSVPSNAKPQCSRSQVQVKSPVPFEQLAVIQEENEDDEDDYPFDF